MFHAGLTQSLAPATPYEAVLAESLISIEWELLQHRRMHEACQHMMQAITQGTITVHGAQLLRAMVPRLQLQSLKNDVHRTLKRYVAEARAQKRKALNIWLAEGGATLPVAKPIHNSSNPETNPNSRLDCT